MKRFILAAIFFAVECAPALAQQPLKILQTDVDEDAGTLTIMGNNFGAPDPEVTLAGQTLSILAYAEDATPSTPKKDSQITAQLPSPIQPGTYLLRVADSVNPASEYDEFNVQIGGATTSQLLIRSAEPGFDTQACLSPCAGTLLISGLNLGSSPPFSGVVTLYRPGYGDEELPVLAFNAISQELLTELPLQFGAVSGSLLLKVATGGGQGEFDAFHVTLERDADPSDELQALTRDGTNLTLSKGGGQVSVEDSDADPTNELQSLSQEGNVVSLSQNGGSVAIDIDDADADPGNELQVLSVTGTDLTLSRDGGTVSLNDADADPANELQTMERVGSEISLSHGGGTVSVEDSDPDPENEKVSEFLLDGYTLRLTESGQQRSVDMSGFLPPPNPDPDPTNELQTLTANPDYTVTLSGGGGTVAINPSILTDQLNTGVGVRAFPHLVSGLTTAANNTAVGSLAMANAYDDSFGNTAVGTTALANLTTGNFNTALGDRALGYSSAGTWNTAVGHGALLHTTGNENTGVGSDALGGNHSGSRNTGLGHYALRQNQSSGNTAVGHRAGFNNISGANNLYLNHEGVDGEFGTIRIGGAVHSRTFLAGVRQVNVTANPMPVVIDESGQLGVADASPGITGFGRYVQTNRVDTPGGASDTVQVSCQVPGQRALGGGGMSNLNPCIFLARSRPVSDTTWSATFVNQCGGYVWQHEITAYVICATVQTQ